MTSAGRRLRVSAGFSFGFPVFSDMQHPAECEGQIKIQIQNTVYGHDERPSDRKKGFAPETVCKLRPSNLEPMPQTFVF